MKKWETIQDYKKHFISLIELERNEEILRHKVEIKNLSGRQREKKGRAILALNGRDGGRGLGGIFYVKLNRRNGLPNTEIGIGDLVILSSGYPSGKEAQAVVTEKTRNAITIAYTNMPPSYAYRKDLRLDLFANDISFQRMRQALIGLQEPYLLSQMLLNIQQPTISGEAVLEEIVWTNEKLNNSQRLAVVQSLNADQLFLVHGPPGTGKTTTLIEIIGQHVARGKKVLSTADSNTAVDNMVEKLLRTETKVLRVGNPARMHPDIIAVSLDFQLQNEDKYQEAATMWDKVFEIKKKQRELTVPNGPNSRGLSDEEITRLAKKGAETRGIPVHKLKQMAYWISLQQEVNELVVSAKKLEREAVVALLDAAEVICSTNISAGSDILEGYQFNLVVVDEATQAVEPSCLVPMTKGRKWILAGDHKQLPPTVVCNEARDLFYTLFERWIILWRKQVSQILQVQYRMHQKIMSFSNNNFYHGNLLAHESVKGHTLADLPSFQVDDYASDTIKAILDPEVPVVFIPVEGHEQQLHDSFSYFNTLEQDKVLEIVNNLLASRLFPQDIGVISPYELQVQQLSQKLRDTEVEIKTVDGYQGREKEVIILSTVRANEEGSLGFLTDFRRLNVAVTRAKRKMILIGNEKTLLNDKFFKYFLEQAYRY